MTTEIRFQLNARFDKDSNMSVSISSFANDEQEAREVGKDAARMVTAYIAGYSEGAEEAARP